MSSEHGWLAIALSQLAEQHIICSEDRDKRDRLGRSRLIDSTSGIHVSRRSCNVP